MDYITEDKDVYVFVCSHCNISVSFNKKNHKNRQQVFNKIKSINSLRNSESYHNYMLEWIDRVRRYFALPYRKILSDIRANGEFVFFEENYRDCTKEQIGVVKEIYEKTRY